MGQPMVCNRNLIKKGFDIMSIITEKERAYLLNSMEELLDEYDYSYTSEALEEIIDTWKDEKGGLIAAFKKHPNYLEGKFMIAFDADYERKIDRNASYHFKHWIINTAMPDRIDQYPTIITDGDYYCGLSYNVYCFFSYLDNYAERCVSENTARYLGEIFTELHFHAGQKTSRVVNKICQYLGFDKVDGYNREFAKYADSLSPLTIKRHTVLSINPLDYLTMSFGNSWASCHTIDNGNKRGMPNSYSGCYSSGTISYMLDKVSMVLYTVDAAYDGKEYWNQPKINRQMFHYGEEKLVQGRLYPQDNDGDDSVYVPYRNIVQQIVATIFDFPNLWTLKKGTYEVGQYVWHNGTNYPDYKHFDNCSVSRVKGSENESVISIGARPICIQCGGRHRVEDNICCCNYKICEDCGCRINDEDVIWIDGDPYCRDCVHYCEYCEEYHRGDEVYVRYYGYVCTECADEHFYCCEHCGTYLREDDAYYIECEDRYVCENCLDRNYTKCEDCGEYIPDGDVCWHGDYALCEDCYAERTETTDEEVC
jgi:hypothetical protein